MSATAGNDIIETTRRRRIYGHLKHPNQTPLRSRASERAIYVFRQYIRAPMAAAVADGLIGTAMKRCIPGPLNRPNRTNLRPARLICSTRH